MGQLFDTPLDRILQTEGRSQAWLARQVGVERQRMNLIVHGLIPTQDEATKIAEALGRQLSELWDVPITEAAA